MLTNHFTDDSAPQPPARKPIEKERKTAARAYEYATSLMPCLRQRIIDSLRAGRDVKHCAGEFGVTQHLAMELWMRADMRRMDARLAAIEDALRTPPGTRLRLVA